MLQHLQILGQIITHPANRSNPLQAVIRAGAWRLGASRRNQKTAIRVFDYKIQLEPNRNGTRGLIYFTDHCDFDHVHFIKKYLRHDDGFVDVGANIGIFTLLSASLVGKTGVIHSFEPVPSTFDLLQSSIRANGITNAVLHRIALGKHEGQTTFTSDDDTTNHVVTAQNPHLPERVLEVQITTLDAALPSDRRWAMWKLDAEGYELAILQGASGWLAKKPPPALSVEINGASNRYGISPSDLVEYLAGFGYRPSLYSAKKNHLDFASEPWGDVIFVQKSAFSLVKDRLKCSVGGW